MKKILNIIVAFAILSTMIFSLSACGEKPESDGKNMIEENSPEIIDEKVEDVKVKVKSTEDSIIIAEEESGTKMTLVFDEEDKVKDFYMTAEVETEEDAQLLKDIYSSEEFASDCIARVEGKMVIIEYNDKYIETMFKDETRATIEASLVAVDE